MSVALKEAHEIMWNGAANCAQMDLYVDTAADLSGLTIFDDVTLLCGSSALDIETGDEYRMQTDGTWVKQPGAGAFDNVYTKAEIDSMLLSYYTKAEADDLFEWITVTISTDILPQTFIADGNPLISWSMKGNGSQQGTPTPDNPVMPEYVGTLDDSDWTIPITCAGQTVPVYLGTVQTVRSIKKLVLTGEEDWYSNHLSVSLFNISIADYVKNTNATICLCTHYKAQKNITLWTEVQDKSVCFFDTTSSLFYLRDSDFSTVADFKSYLAAQYAAGHPVTVWYVLATEQTAIVNEPLAKIGDYADELHSTDAAVTIPTAKGNNVLTIESEVQPSEITITGKIRET